LKRGILIALLAACSAAPARAACPADPAFDPAVPTWESVNGFQLGSRQAGYGEVVKYLEAVDAASAQVSGGRLARKTWQDRTLPFVAVSRAAHLRPKRLAAIARTTRAMRDARLSTRQIRSAARKQPGIVNVASNVHGNEPSGTDASMKLLYELAARTDCANLRRLERLVTFILPLQNPDGREAGTRENGYGFDMNRDWFARTQPETDGKVELVRHYPPLFFIDAHEQAGTAYFFPPNADPIHHEISAQAIDAINNTYAPAMKQAAARDGFDYTNYTTYDLFFMGYGDTVPSTAFGSAGMTFEKGGQSPYNEKTAEQFATQDATLTAAAENKERLVTAWARQWPEAAAQGRGGALEPNLVVQPENTVQFPVPAVKVYGYFLRADRSTGDAARLARRLNALDVRVYRLARKATLRGAHGYGVPGFRSQTLPAGTFWIPMGQPQKHWIQALLGEDSYVPFPYFYDVSGWSNPLLMGLDGGFASSPNRRLRVERWRGSSLGVLTGDRAAWSFATDSSEAFAFIFDFIEAGGKVARSGGSAYASGLDMAATARLARDHDVPLRAVAAAPEGAIELKRPRVAVLADAATLSGSSSGFAKFVLEQRFGLETKALNSVELEAGGLATGGFDAVVVPAGLVPTGGFTPAGLAQLRLYVQGGGRYVGLGRAGLTVANAAGLTLTAESAPPPDYQVPGASFRMLVDPAEPLGWGYRKESFVFNVGDPIVAAAATGKVVASYPAGERFFVSGYTEGADALKGTPAAISETVGSGQAVVFTFDAAFRAYTESTMPMFANALLHPVGGGDGAAAAGHRLRPQLLASALPAAPDSVVRVPAADEVALRGAAAGAGVPAGARFTSDLDGVSLRVPNPRGLDVEQRSWPPRLLDALRRAGVRPTLIVL
jgi:Zinc carboxypeptidase